VLLIQSVAGSLYATVAAIVNDPNPKVVIKLLGSTLPLSANFFCAFILTKGVAGFAHELLGVDRIADRVLTSAKRAALAAAAAAQNAAAAVQQSVGTALAADEGGGGPKDGAQSAPKVPEPVVGGWQPKEVNYLNLVPNQLLVLVLTLTFASISPVILLASLLYFGIGYLVFKHQLLHHYLPDTDSDGSFFLRIFTHALDALLIGQVTMFGMILLKAPSASGVRFIAPMAVLPLATVCFKAHCITKFSGCVGQLPLPDACRSDAAAAAAAGRADVGLGVGLLEEGSTPQVQGGGGGNANANAFKTAACLQVESELKLSEFGALQLQKYRGLLAAAAAASLSPLAEDLTEPLNPLSYQPPAPL
jgi:hypothetical protein